MPLPPTWLSYSLFGIWALGEAWLIITRRAKAAQSRDRGSLPVLIGVLSAAMTLAVLAGMAGVAPLPRAWRPSAAWLGVAAMTTGIALRWWSVRVLAERFTVHVAIGAEHQLVRTGPYRFLRHPSYTGELLCFTGVGLLLSDWVSLALTTLPAFFALLYRIRIEEAVLAQAFPNDYPAYALQTKRLIPFIW